MYREITIVNTPVYQMPIPKELRGRKIEIIAFAVEEEKQMSTYNNNVSNLLGFANRTKDLTHDAEGYHSDRNQANDYE